MTLTNSATRGIISQTDYFDKQISNPKNLDGYYVVSDNDFVYNPRISLNAPFGPINRNTLRITGIMSPLYYVFTPKNINLNFLEFYFKTTKWHKFMYQNGDTGARSDRFSISNKLLETMPIKIPGELEQDHIGKMLTVLEKTITLEQEKLNKLKNLNDQILRMFIYKNWKYSLNYSKSTQQFEKVTLNRILKETNNKTTINNQHEILSSTNDGLYLQSEYFKRQVASKNNIGYKILERNQLVLSPQNLWLGNINFNDKYEIGIVSPSYKTFDINTDFNKYFIGRILSMKEMEQKYMSASEQGASVVRRNLNIDEFNQISLFLPDLATQNFISEFIQNIEDNIYKRSINIQKYSQIKTTLLSEMFV